MPAASFQPQLSCPGPEHRLAMSQSKPPHHKPVTLEKRKSLLYNSNKRRSIKAIIVLSLIALAAGLAIAYLLRGLVVIDGSASRSPGIEAELQRVAYARPE